MDICLIREKLGGNAPFMADGMAALSDHVSLIGALGLPERHPCFAELHSAVDAVSFAEPFHTIGFEFDDGKIMMGHIPDDNPITWERMTGVLGMETITRQVQQADLIAILNWSAHFGVGRIAAEVARLAEMPGKASPLLFFDLSDPTSLPDDRLLTCLDELADIGTHLPTVLGMNENEARVVLRCLFSGVEDGMDILPLLNEYGQAAVRRLHLQALVVHSTDKAFGLTADECWVAEGYLVRKPQYLTGGGDHFNAGLCHGLIHGLPLPQCLMLGNAASSFFVQNGHSANPGGLLRRIESTQTEVHPS